MKKLYSIMVVLLLAASAFAADTLRVEGNILANYSTLTTLFQQYAATNTSMDTSVISNYTGPAHWGYTNTSLWPIYLGNNTKVGFGVVSKSARTTCTNTMTLRVWPSIDGVNKITRDGNAAATGYSFTIPQNGTTAVYWMTNTFAHEPAQMMGSLSIAPYALVQFENPTNTTAAAGATNYSSLAPTNLVIRYWLKP